MRPQTVHFVLQAVRHTRGLVTTIEKWVAQTPADVFASECEEVIRVVRSALQEIHTTVGTSRSSTAPMPPTTTPADRPAVVAARSSVPRGT